MSGPYFYYPGFDAGQQQEVLEMQEQEAPAGYFEQLIGRHKA